MSACEAVCLLPKQKHSWGEAQQLLENTAVGHDWTPPGQNCTWGEVDDLCDEPHDDPGSWHLLLHEPWTHCPGRGIPSLMAGKAILLSMVWRMKFCSFCPFTLTLPLCFGSHAKCNLQHCLHLFTFTNYIPFKLPRKICQKKVITQSWNLASNEISSLPFCKRAL